VTRKRIVILGGGTGGTMTANRLRRRFDAEEAEIHVVDRDDKHVYQPGLLFVPFGLAQLEEIVRPRPRAGRHVSPWHVPHRTPHRPAIRLRISKSGLTDAPVEHDTWRLRHP
jgi:NADH dehydrogenase FAD-containing subunit